MPAAHAVVLYNAPKDPKHFEQYYEQTHLPLLYQHAKEIAYTKAVFVKFEPGPDGKPPAFYRKAELIFSSPDAMKKGMSTAGFKAVGGDLGKFATGGVTVVTGVETNT